MIQHTVCFTLAHDEGSDAERDFLATAATTLPAIPGVTNFRVARQTGSQSDLRWQLAMDFADETAYAAYNEHPSHRAFVEGRWGPEVATFTEFDFVPVDTAAL